ncbi:hypothetical protein GCM10027289_24450 [Tsukamurella serpentis]
MPLVLAAAHIRVRRVRRELRRRLRPATHAIDPTLRIEADGTRLTVLGPDAAITVATMLGLDRGASRRDLHDGALTAFAIDQTHGRGAVALCRVDRGTATAELHLTGDLDRRAASPLHAAALRLAHAQPDLRRIAITVPDEHELGGALVAAGLTDEGWAPPVRGGGPARMVTHLC